MVCVKSVEQYLWYEIVATVQVVVGVISGQSDENISGRDLIQIQMKKLSNAFHLFMLDLEANEFRKEEAYRALQLPSERQAESESNDTEKTESGSSVGKQLGTQLQLFFVKPTKVMLGSLIEVSEVLISRSKNVWGREREYTNTYKNSRR